MDPVVLSFVRVRLLALAVLRLSSTIGYCARTGCAPGVTAGGMMLFGEKLSAVQAAFMALTVIGIVGTRLLAHA